MKILYASDNRRGSTATLYRFLRSFKYKKHTLKVAAFSLSLDKISVDYTLDCLLNFSRPHSPGISFNGNYQFYFNEIKRFNPDLIISDFEIYTSIIGLELNIKLWQCSPMLLTKAFSHETLYNIKWIKNYESILKPDHKRMSYEEIITIHSDKRFVLSHLCDAAPKIKLNKEFEWVRPYFCFEDEKQEITPVVGTGSWLDDAFYNQKRPLFRPNFLDKESIVQAAVAEYYGFGGTEIINNMQTDKSLDIEINDKVKFLHEKIDEMCGD